MADQGADVVIVDMHGTEHHFPAGFDPVKAASIVKTQPGTTQITQAEWDALPVKDKLERAAKWAGYSLAGMTGMMGRDAVDHPGRTLATAALPIAGSAISKGAVELATNPNVAKTAASIGRGVGAVTSLPTGLAGFGSIQRGAWNGGRAGYFTGKLAQDVAGSIVNAVDKAKTAIAAGVAPSKAAMDASEGNPSMFAAIVSHFMKSGGVK